MAKTCKGKEFAKKVIKHEKAELAEDKKDARNDKKVLSAAKKLAKKK